MNIILSGASSGVGFEAVIELIGNQHHQIIALARSEEKLHKLQEIAFALNPGCNLYVLKFDIAHDDYENKLIQLPQQICFFWLRSPLKPLFFRIACSVCQKYFFLKIQLHL